MTQPRTRSSAGTKAPAVAGDSAAAGDFDAAARPGSTAKRDGTSARGTTEARAGTTAARAGTTAARAATAKRASTTARASTSSRAGTGTRAATSTRTGGSTRAATSTRTGGSTRAATSTRTGGSTRAATSTRGGGTRAGGAGNGSARGSGSEARAGSAVLDTRLPAGAPESLRRTVLLPRSPTTGLESSRVRLTPAERQVRGKAARAEVPRESHAGWQPPPDRPDPVALLESQATSRLPDLVPVRYGRMMESPFTYYRGAALPMASDLATTPSCGLIVQACGDAHLSNFGLFGSPERKLIFDVNDFDETLPGPWEWDVKRLAASLEVAARENGFAERDRRKIVLATVARYRTSMRGFAKLDNLDVWYTQVDIDELRQQAAGC